jgi:nicotinamide-nucleotide amidase
MLKNFYSILGKSIIAEGKNKVQFILADLIKTKRCTLSVTESCSGGRISHAITKIPGCSSFYKGSITAYSNEIKENLLHVNPQTLKKHGAVSQETAIEMVQGIAAAFKTNLAISTTGIAGPDGGTIDKPVGTVWIATYVNGDVQVNKYKFWHDRIINIERTATVAMYDLIKHVNNRC